MKQDYLRTIPAKIERTYRFRSSTESCTECQADLREASRHSQILMAIGADGPILVVPLLVTRSLATPGPSREIAVASPAANLRLSKSLGGTMLRSSPTLSREVRNAKMDKKKILSLNTSGNHGSELAVSVGRPTTPGGRAPSAAY